MIPIVRNFSIKTQLTILCLIILVPLLVFQGMEIRGKYRTLYDHEVQANLEIARAARMMFLGYVHSVLRTEAAIISSMTLTERSPEEITQVLNRCKQESQITDFSWLNSQGIVISSTAPGAVGLDLSDRPSFQEIQKKEWNITNLILGTVTGKPIFFINRAIRDRAGNFQGMLAASINEEGLTKELSFERGKTAAASIVDGNGMLVFRSPKLEATWEERNWLKEYPVYKEPFEGREYTGTVVAQYDGKPRIIALVPMPFGWVAGAGRSEDEVVGFVFSQIQTSLIVFGIVLAVALVAVAIVSKQTTRSVRALQERSDAVSRGEFVAKEHLASTKEFLGLSNALNTMSEKVRAREESLRESEQRFRLAQQASRIGTFEVNIHTGEVVWTPELEAIYGLQPGGFEKTQRAWEQLVHPDDRDEALRLVERSFESGESVAGEWRTVWRDGSVHWIAARWQVLKDEAGKPLRMIGVNMDITARKQAETELARTKTLLETLLLQTPVGFCFLDRELRFIMINDRLAELNGFTVAAHIGATVAEIVPSLLPTVQEVTERILATGDAVVGHEFSFETPLQPGVTRYWSESWYPVSDSAGAIIGFGVIAEEITARKQAVEALRQSQERLSLAVHGAGMGTWDEDCRTGRSIWSHTHFEMLGYPVNETGEATQEMWRSRVHPDDLSEVTRALETARSTGSLYAPEHRIIRADTGEVRWLSVAGRFLRDDAGETVRFVGIFFDTTERKKADEALRRLNENLEQAVQERTEKLRRLASELTLVEQRERKKLSTILHDGLQQYLVAAKMQLNGLMPEVAEEGLKRSISDIEQILGDAVQVSRSLAAELSPPILRDAGILAGLEWLSRWMLEKHQLKVQLIMEMDAPALEEDVRILLFESVRELLLNTIKHSNSRSAKIHLFQSPGDHLGLTVSDDGKGFTPGASNDAASKEGFGLFSIQERLSVIGGTFKIDSAPGKGCRITLTAPLGRPKLMVSSQTASETEPVPSPASAGVALGKVRILIVDDHIVMREGLARLLAQEPDFDVIGQATNGQQAIEKAASLQPALILMDISMPVLDGIEATKIIHQRHPHIHIVGLSLYTEDERAREMLSAGASFYMSKSSPPSELRAAIRSCFGETGPISDPSKRLVGKLIQ